MKKIVISEFMDEEAVASLRSRYDVCYDPTLVERLDALTEALASAAALIVRNRTRVTSALLDAAPALRVVGRLGVGLDNIDLAACDARGIAVAPAVGANTRAVAEYVIAALLMAIRGAFHASDAVAAGEWPRIALSNGREIAGKTLALIGFGDIGQHVARLASALGMCVVAHDAMLAEAAPAWHSTDARRVTFDEALARADAVSLHVPLTPATRGLIGAAQLALMKSDAVLINTSRGGIVDEAALADALRRGTLGGAVLDVFETEPLPTRSVLAGVPRLVLTPHIAGLTTESNIRVSAMVAQRVLALLAA